MGDNPRQWVIIVGQLARASLLGQPGFQFHVLHIEPGGLKETLHENTSIRCRRRWRGRSRLDGSLYASKTANTAVLSKLYPTRSHTGTAQGGVGAALGNIEEDHPEWHTFDTVKGSDYLGDQDAIEFMCNEAVQAVYELEHMGLPFSRTPDGQIAQRPFGGHTNNITGKPVPRACYAADRTGHMILQTLYQQCIKNKVNFFDEFQVVDLILVRRRSRRRGGHRAGHRRIAHFPRQSGDLRHRRARAHLGDHFQCLYLHRRWCCDHLRRGIPAEDMEFFQFHPTGIYQAGHSDHRGRARRRRRSAQRRGRALYGDAMPPR